MPKPVVGSLNLSPHTKILIYDLTDEDARHAAKLADKAEAMSLVLWDLDQWLRNKVKYPADTDPTDGVEAFEQARAQLRELCVSHSIDMDE
jgi:hypothetical protein